MKKNKATAIGYIRCAVKDETGSVLQLQEAAINEYCAKHNLRVAIIFKDDGAGGNDFQRAGWKELKRYLRNNEGKVKFLIAKDYDRLGRNIYTLHREIAGLQKDFGIEIHVADMNKPVLREPLHVKTKGNWVMVDPHLTTDPMNRRGEIAKTLDTFFDGDITSVIFTDGVMGRYMTDGLLALYPKDMILQRLVTNAGINEEDRNLIKSVLKLVTDRRYPKALKQAVSSEVVKSICTTNYVDLLEIKQQQKRNKGKSQRH